MRISIYTDAGIKDGVATWATVVIAEGREPVEAYGRLRADLDCTATAELRAIANALHKMIHRGEIARGDEVRVFSDSMHAVERINGKLIKRPESRMAKATTVILALGSVHGITISAQWVRGHQAATSLDPHAAHNRRCDALCRLARTLPRPSKAMRAYAVARRLAGGAV